MKILDSETGDQQNCSYCGRDNQAASIHCFECGTALPPMATSWEETDSDPGSYHVLSADTVTADIHSSPPPLPLCLPRRTTNHPVADNPIRLLAGEGWTTPRDLVKAARRLKLMARDAVIEAVEPAREVCLRLRAQEDYVAAERQVTDAIEFATAAAFVPDHWTDPVTETGQANLLLLQAEMLPQGDGRKADLVNRAVRCWDSEAGTAAIQAACAQAEKYFGAHVDAAEVQHRVGKALCAVAEQVIADFGASIDVSEIELLNTLDGCQRLPEPRGAAAAGDMVVLKQQERIDRYLNEAIAVVNSVKRSAEGTLSKTKIQGLVAGCKEARQAFDLLQRRPALFHRLPDDRQRHVATVSIALAFELGWHHSKWAEASALAAGVQAEHIDQRMDQQMRRLFIVSCQAIPLMARVAKGNDKTNELEALKRFYPHCSQEIDAFKFRSLEMLGRVSTFSQPQPGNQTAEPSGVSLGMIIFGIVAVIGMLRSCNTGRNEVPSRTAYQRPAPSRPAYERPVPVASPPHRLSIEHLSPDPPPQAVLTDPNTFDEESLGVSRARILKLNNDMEILAREIDRDRPLVDRRNRSSVDVFNSRVRALNNLVARAKSEQAAYNAAVDKHNQSLLTNAP